MIDPKFLDQLKNLNLLSRKKVSSVYVGSRSSIKQGRGLEVYDYREYYPGDDFRAIDWKLYGRTEKLYIRRFEEEKDFSVHILLDSSSSMDFSTNNVNKFDYAGSIAAGFAYLSMNRYEKFALGLYADKVIEVIPAKKGKMQFFRFANVINTAKQVGVTNMGDSMNEYSSFIKTKSFVIVVSDFLEPMESLKKGIYRVARQSKEAILVQVLDPGEINLTWNDDIEFEDMETAKMEKVFLSPNFKKDYAQKFKEHIMTLREICQDTGIDFYSVSTDKPLFDSFVNIIEGRAKKGLFEFDKPTTPQPQKA
jgi:uncharacterized protein (DUF58 family)